MWEPQAPTYLHTHTLTHTHTHSQTHTHTHTLTHTYCVVSVNLCTKYHYFYILIFGIILQLIYLLIFNMD